MTNLLSNDDLWLLEPAAYLRLSTMPDVEPLRQGNAPSAAYQQTGKLATVPIHGTMMRQVGGFRRMLHSALGEPFAETGALAQIMAQLQNDPSINAVLLDIDSPGGSVNGTPELAAAVARLSREKHVYAYTAGLCCSAAYWVASQADAIYAAPSARLGSIGVLLPISDTSEAYNRNGVKVDVISAGKYKSTGVQGTALSEEQRALLQAQVNNTWADFKAAVNRRRNIADSYMEGQTFTGTEAKNLGLADARADSLEFLQEKLAARHA